MQGGSDEAFEEAVEWVVEYWGERAGEEEGLRCEVEGGAGEAWCNDKQGHGWGP